MSGVSFTLERAIELAAEKNCRVRYPAPNELFLDIDNDDDFEHFEAALAILRTHIEVDGFDVTVSRSGVPNRHIVVRLVRPVANDMERVLLQAVLGSDRVHEMLSLIAMKKGTMTHPTLLFEPKGEEAAA